MMTWRALAPSEPCPGTGSDGAKALQRTAILGPRPEPAQDPLHAGTPYARSRRPGAPADRAETDRAVRPSGRGQDDAPGHVLSRGLDREGARGAPGGDRPDQRRVPGREDRPDRSG